MHLPGRCAPDNQCHIPFPDLTQTTRCHQVVRPQRPGDEARRHICLSQNASRIERNPFEARHTGSQHVGGSSPKLNPKECACLAGSCRLGAKLTRQTLGSHSATLPIQRNAVEAKRTGIQDGGGTGHKLNSQKCVYFAVRCLLDTYRGEVYPSYSLIEQGC